MVFKEPSLNTFYFGQVMQWSLKELFFNSFYFEEGVLVFKELIFNSFHFGRVQW